MKTTATATAPANLNALNGSLNALNDSLTKAEIEH